MEREMIKRLNRQSIANFIMSGSETLKFAEGNFDERLQKGEGRINMERIRLIRLVFSRRA